MKNPIVDEKVSDRVRRVGGWRNYPYGTRVLYRNYDHPTYRLDDTGFRLVRNAS